MRIPPEAIADWVEANFDFKVRKNGDEYLIANPWADNDKKKLGICCSKGIMHDWRGDEWARGSPPTFIRFVQLYRKCSFKEAVREVCGSDSGALLALRKLKERHEPAQNTFGVTLPKGSQPLWTSQSKLAEMLIKWLASRGVSGEMIQQYKIHHLGADVIWPYYEYDELVYWQSRNMWNKVYRFPAVEGVGKGMFLYGFDMIEPSSYLIITEAIFGASTLGVQTGATGGASMTTDQLRKVRILNPVDGVILAPDNDKAGRDSILHNAKLIEPYFKVFYAMPPRLPYSGDDGEMKTTKDWNELYTHGHTALPSIRGLFEKRVKPLGVREKFLLSQAS